MFLSPFSPFFTSLCHPHCITPLQGFHTWQWWGVLNRWQLLLLCPLLVYHLTCFDSKVRSDHEKFWFFWGLPSPKGSKHFPFVVPIIAGSHVNAAGSCRVWTSVWICSQDPRISQSLKQVINGIWTCDGQSVAILRTQFRSAARKEADDVPFPYGCSAERGWDSCANPVWWKLWA